MRNEPLVLTLELLRKHEAGDPFAFSFQEQEYVRRRADGTVRSAVFPWNQGLLQDLANLERREPDVGLIRRLGEVLRGFLEEMGWEGDEQTLRQALRREQEVHLTVRAAAAEMYALPWELLTLRDSGQHLGQQRGCTVRYEWTGAPPGAASEPSSEGRILFAWSAAGGEVPAGRHLEVLREACRRGDFPFEEERDVLANVSLPSLSRELERSRRAGEPVSVLHLLCHGTQREHVGPDGRSRKEYGLVWNEAGPGAPGDFVVADRLKEVLEPHADTLRLVVLCACQGGQEQPGSHLGSVARELHRVGIAAVVASRLRLSVEGSVTLAEALYGGLLGVPESSEAPLEAPRSLEAALGAARKRLRELGLMDWASLQLYARADAGPGIRPLPIRPYRGLLAFEPAHRRFFFGRSELERQLVARARAAMEGRGPRFQVVAGASGSGKSSLVLAGLVPRLREVESGGWDTRVMQPSEAGSHRVPEGPGRFGTLGRLRELLYGLHRMGEAPTLQGASVEEVLQEARLLRSVRPGRCLLLVVDQFEEVFTQVQRAEEREAFARAVWELAKEEALQVLVVATLRVDAFERCGEVRVDPEGLRLDAVVYSDSHRLFVSQLQAGQLSEIIEEPARAVGLELEPGLAEVLRRDVEQEPGALPLLEHALDQLWERRVGHRLTQAAYLEIGGVAGAIARTGDQLHDELPEAERHQARRLLVKLVDLRDETSPHTRRREWLKAVRPGQAEAAAAFDSVVEKLVRRRLVVKGADRDTRGRPSETWLQIAHEALIRRWDKLVRWVQEDRERELQVREVEDWATDWRGHRGSPDGGASYLAGGERLAYALEVGKKHSEGLTEGAREFLERSRELETRRKQEDAERRRAALDVSRVLQTRRLLESDPTLAALVLGEVMDPEKTPEWHQTAIEVLQRPLSTAILGPRLGARLVGVSRDGQRVAIAAQDGTVRVWRTDGLGAPVVLSGHRGKVRSAAFSADGQRVVTASEDGTARVWRADGHGQPVVLEGHTEGVAYAKFSPNGQRVLTMSEDGRALLWTVDGSEEPVMLARSSWNWWQKRTEAVAYAAFSVDGQRILTRSRGGTVRVEGVDGREKPRVLEAGITGGVEYAKLSPKGGVLLMLESGVAAVWDEGSVPSVLEGLPGRGRVVKFSGNGQHLLLAAGGVAQVWSWEEWPPRLLGVLEGHAGGVAYAAFSADGQRVVSAAQDGPVRVWPVDGLGEPLVLSGYEGRVGYVAFSADGQRVLTASREEGPVRVWRARGALEPVVLAGSEGRVGYAAFSADGQRVLTRVEEGPVRVWRVDGSGEPVLLTRFEGKVAFARFSPDGRRMVTVSRKGMVLSWREEGETWKPVVLAHSWGRVESTEFSPDGQHVLAVTQEGGARVWRVDGSWEHPGLARHTGGVGYAKFSADGQRVLTASRHGEVLLWRVEGGGEPVALKGHEGWVRYAEFSADGQRVLTRSEHDAVRVWRVDGHGEHVVLTGHEKAVAFAEFSADGQRVVTASRDGTARVWRADKHGEPVVLSGHTEGVELAKFSPDGQWVVTVSWDGTARLWRADGHGEPVVLARHSGGVRFLAVAFSSDGRRVVLVSEDGTARVWKADGSGEPFMISDACGQVRAAEINREGSRILLLTERTLRLWSISTDRLQRLLREATTASLTPEQRQRYLLETPEEARAGHARSERERGRSP